LAQFLRTAPQTRSTWGVAVIDPFDTLARYAFMIGITISGKAYAAIASMLPNHATERELLPDRAIEFGYPYRCRTPTRRA
jgi:hypothetical protein